MAQPSNRTELIDYCKRQLGAPVLEINIADEQVEDLVDDAVQYFQERHFDGVYPALFKYKITQDDIDRGTSQPGKEGSVGITTETATQSFDGATQSFTWNENGNYLKVPDNIIGITKIFHYDGSNAISSGMFSIKYQMFLNDIYYMGASEILSYAMTKTYLADLDFLLTTQKQIRFNKRQERLYLDIDWNTINKDDYVIVDCFSTLDPSDYGKVWNDSFLKKYLTATMKRQWGQNLIKFAGVKLPGGIELNGRQIYDDAEKDLEIIRDQMSNTHELPPQDMIG